MSFQSIEEKIIYEKLMDGKDNGVPDGSGTPAVYEQHAGPINVKRLQTLMNNVSGYSDIMENTRVNTSFRHIHPGRRKVIAGLIVFIKRLIRRITRWYVEPVCQQQTAFNNAVSPSIGCITEINNEIIGGVLALFREQDAQRERYEALIQAERAAADARMTEMESDYKTRISEAYRQLEDAQHASYQQLETLQHTAHQQLEAVQRGSHQQLEAVQRTANQQLIDLQNRMDKLNRLELDVFAENYEDPWEKDAWGVGTFSQSGEDMASSFILRVLGMPLEQVTYVDLGANHAKKFSNTYHFYKHGARGVLVEANPALIPELKFYRNGDVILNRCVSAHSGDTVDFYVMGDSCATGDGLSTPDKNSAVAFTEINPALRIHDTVRVETLSVADIVKTYLGKSPILLNIDIEGNEVAILRSIDFTQIRPLIIIIETIPYTLPFVITDRNQEILDCLTNAGYLEYAFTGINSIFLDRAQLRERGVIR